MASPAPQFYLRSDAEIREKLREYTASDYETASGPLYLAGVRDSLRWLLGESSQSPVTRLSSPGRPDYWTVNREAGRAEEGMRGASTSGRRWRRDLGLAYLTACENTLWWATGGEGI